MQALGIMKKILDRIYFNAAPFLARQAVRALFATMRVTYVNFEWYRRHVAEGGRIILAFWHGRLLMMPYSYPGRGITILVSTSRDGELIARTVRGFGIESVRGSSTRGWVSGIKGLLQSIKNGRDAAITPDGPKGPGMRAQMGVIQIARATGLPIVPVTFNASKKKPSGAGIRSSCPIPSPGAFLSAASRYALKAARTTAGWRRPGPDLRRPLTS